MLVLTALHIDLNMLPDQSFLYPVYVGFYPLVGAYWHIIEPRIGGVPPCGAVIRLIMHQLDPTLLLLCIILGK